MTEKPKIFRSEFTKDVENLSWKDLTDKYKVSKQNLEKLIQQWGLTKKRATTIPFEAIDDCTDNCTDSNNADAPPAQRAEVVVTESLEPELTIENLPF